MTLAYYNEIEPRAVAALEQLIREGVIAPGVVDSRSIAEVQAHELRPFQQWHFFAGGGLWSVAARAAGWPDDRPLGSASCPCQPFSAAGQQGGTDDPRHLWPHVHRIYRAARLAGFAPPVLMGEQVAGKAGYDWFDGVRASLASEGVAARVVDIPACSVDAPHERNRQYWLAVADAQECGGGSGLREAGTERHGSFAANSDGRYGILADTESERSGRVEPVGRSQGRTTNGRLDARGNVADTDVAFVQGQPRAGELRGHEQDRRADQGHADGSHGTMEHTESDGRSQGWSEHELYSGGHTFARADGARAMGDAICAGRQGQFRNGYNWSRWAQSNRSASSANVGRPNGSWWCDAEWIECHDGKARRAKPGVPMLVNGMAGRSALWSLAGNSIVPVIAQEVIAAYLDSERSAAPVLVPALPY